ncbi:MAG TPA: EamA family transporter [Steroidobacteraceae bacterium]|nr:EamA family transporter [Steroidobacteraceae bacterium]
MKLKSDTVAAPIAVLIAAMFCFQLGAVMAKGLFPMVGAAGTTALRMALASFMLLAVWRPWRMRPTPREIRVIVMYGLALGCMNFCFYLSLNSIPLGIAVALEFAGPLALAMAASRRPIDFAWILMAALGLLALLPLGLESKPLDAGGVGYALAAGVFWALYIFYGRKAGAAHGGQTTALGMVVGAIVIVPIGVAEAGARLLSPAILPAALGVALLSSALPYSLEMLAMPRLPTRTVGVLMSLDPALGALSGLSFLGERLSWIQWAAIASIMAASAGSAATSRPRPPIIARLPD